ncbi:MAG: 31 protein [Thermodesulfobacteriota bacterium]|nr:31 protein [Thermodesulfobacteriota bacterium]
MENRNPGNWLFAIAGINLPLVLWGIFLVAIAVTCLTFLFSPIYKATTILTLDSDAEKVLRGIDLAYPTTQSTDYIRFEYFAIHSITLMRSVDLAREVINRCNITDSSGEEVLPENLIEPGLFKLLFKNSGQGIDVDWIADTQQFAITGYSEEPHKAVIVSEAYTEAFLQKNAGQFRDMLKVLMTNLESQLEESKTKIKSIQGDIQKIRLQHNMPDSSNESEKLTGQILEIETSLSSSILEEKTYSRKIEHLSAEATNHEKLLKYRHIMRTNPLVTELNSKIVDLSGELIALSLEYTPTHPDYLRAKEKLHNAKETLRKEAEKSFYEEAKETSPVRDEILSTILNLTINHLIFKSTVEHLQVRLDTYKKRLNELIKAQTAIDYLTNELGTYSDLKNSSQKSIIKIRSTCNNSLPFFRVVSRAWINTDNLKDYKLFPKRKQILLISCVLSFFLFSFLAIAWEMRSNLLYYKWQLSEFGYNFTIVEVPTIGKPSKIIGDFESVLAIYLRGVSGSLFDAKLIRVVNAIEGEGKATVGRTLAWCFNRSGRSVLLVDGDYIHRKCSKALGMEDRPGLTDFLQGDKDIDSVIVQSPVSHMDCIPAGTSGTIEWDSNIRKVLPEILSNLSGRYDKIVFLDTPLNDTLFPLIDGMDQDIVLVLKSGKHSISEFGEILSISQLSRGDRAGISAIVLNCLPFTANVFSVRGLWRLTQHLIRQPFQSFRRPK